MKRSHNGTSVGVFITKHGGGLVINEGRIRGLFMTIITLAKMIVTVMEVVILGNDGGHIRYIVGGERVEFMMITLALMVLTVVLLNSDVVLVLRRVRVQLCLFPDFPHRLQNLLLLRPPHDCHLLHVHVHIDIVHSCNIYSRCLSVILLTSFN